MTTGGRGDVSAMIAPGAHVDPDVDIEGPVRIGPGAVLLGSGDEGGPRTMVHSGADIGGNATITPGVTLGMGSKVNPGAVVTRSVPPLAIVEGNPARIVGYVDTPESDASTRPADADTAPRGVPRTSRVAGVRMHRLRVVHDLRGSLTVAEYGLDLPFHPARYFIVFDVPTAETRGEHAHRRCEQLLSAIRGSVSVVVDDGDAREEFVLDRPDVALYVPPMVWAIQYRYSPDAALLVMASEPYDPADYIRDYGEFRKIARPAGRP